jgi:tRNA G37 N-methylase TrmD
MNDPFISESAIENELKALREQAASLSNNLLLLGQEIKYMINQLKSCSANEQQKYFFLLQNIQGALATIFYKEDLNLPQHLIWFVGDFERIDDDEYKKYLLSKIQSGEYSFGRKLDH